MAGLRPFAAGIVVLAVALLAIAARRPASPRIALPVREVRVTRSAFEHVEMVGPVRPPTSDDEEVRIVVYVDLPEHGTITLRGGALAYPPGTVAERVEYLGRGGVDEPPSADWRVLDVRGTAIGEGGEEWFHVYRPTSGAPDALLMGYAWPRDDAAAQDEATRALGELVSRAVVVKASARSAEHLRAINGCASCHVHDRAPRAKTSDPGLVSRGSDASGFFQVSTALSDRAPLETYRSRNTNLDDPFVRFVCGPRDQPALRDPRAPGGVRCAGDEVPVGVLDLRAALAAEDRHARRLCASRRALFAHLDDPARAAFAPSMRACAAP